MKKAIENISEKVLDFIFDFGSNEYSLENGCYEPENGISEGESLTINGHIDYAGHRVTIGVWYSDREKIVEVLFEEDNYENLEKAVNEHVESKLDFKELMAGAIEDIESCEADEYQRNGFRNEADFWHYKLSA